MGWIERGVNSELHVSGLPAKVQQNGLTTEAGQKMAPTNDRTVPVVIAN